MLVIAESDDSGCAVGGPAFVTRPEAVDPDDASPPAGEMIGRRASYGAEPDHDDIEYRH
jgi:hypothetical protein